MEAPVLPIPHGAKPVELRTLEKREKTMQFSDLCQWLGEPAFSGRLRGSTLLLWRIDEDDVADGVAVVRMSPEDKKGGLTAYTQAKQVMDGSEDRGLRLRYLLVTTHNTAARPFTDRVDLDVLTHCLLQGWLERAVFRSLCRMTRNMISTELSLQLLRESQTELHLLNDFSDPVDWDDDQLMVTFKTMLAKEERKNTRQRTEAGMDEQWLKAGKGHPRLQPFGTRRNEDDFLVCDEETWRSVMEAQGVLLERGDDEKPWTAVIDFMAERGHKFDKDRVYEVLTDPLYECGRAEFEYFDRRYSIRPIDAPVYARPEVSLAIQTLLDQRRGASTHAPPGYFALNGILGLHRPCAGTEVRGEPIRIRGRMQARKDRETGQPLLADDIGYGHTVQPPGIDSDSPCWRDRVAHEDLERAVCQALRQAAADLPAGWVFSKSERERLEAEIAEAERELEVEEELFFEERKRVRAAGGHMGYLEWERWCGGLARRHRRAQKRVLARDALSTLPSSCSIPLSKEAELEFFNELVTDEVPSDPQRRVARAAVLEACLSAYEYWRDEDGEVAVKLYGPVLGHEDDPRPLFPLQSARPHIQAEAMRRILEKKNEVRARRREELESAQGSGRDSDVQTDVQGYAKTSVCTSPFGRVGAVKADLPWLSRPSKNPRNKTLPQSSAWTFERDRITSSIPGPGR